MKLCFPQSGSMFLPKVVIDDPQLEWKPNYFDNGGKNKSGQEKVLLQIMILLSLHLSCISLLMTTLFPLYVIKWKNSMNEWHIKELHGLWKSWRGKAKPNSCPRNTSPSPAMKWTVQLVRLKILVAWIFTSQSCWRDYINGKSCFLWTICWKLAEECQGCKAHMQRKCSGDWLRK